MQQQTPAAPAIHAAHSASASEKHTHRNLWILTGYLASGLALLGVFAYYIAAYLTH